MFLAGASGVLSVRLVPLLVADGHTVAYYEQEVPSPPRIHVNEAARRTVAPLHSPSGVLTIVEE
jgi:hypothetical protein